MANKLVSVFLMCIVVMATLHIRQAVADDGYKTCYEPCDEECKSEGNGDTFCEMKCDTDCLAKKNSTPSSPEGRGRVEQSMGLLAAKEAPISICPSAFNHSFRNVAFRSIAEFKTENDVISFFILVSAGRLANTHRERPVEMGWKAAQKLIQNWKIVRGDNIKETGVIKRVIRSQNRVIVEGKNLVKKHIKQGQGHEGGIFSVEAPLHASNVQVLDPATQKPVKIGIRYLEDGTKVRVSRGEGASGSIIPRPEILKIRTTPRPTVAGPKDTPMDLVLEKTYDAKTGKGMPAL
ncbi:hypothetical protein AAG906_018573 [Vitis piasezkii]